MRKRGSGFTILELLAAIAVISILLGTGISGYSRLQLRARIANARAGLVRWCMALDEYRAEFGHYPVMDPGGPIAGLPPEQLSFLTHAVEDLVLVDAWGGDVYYRRAADPKARFVYRVWSAGPDGLAAEDPFDEAAAENDDNISPSTDG